MAPIIVGTDRLVDPDTSLAFRAIRNTRDELEETDFNRSSICIQKLNNALEDFFESQKQSPLDIDQDGYTLLYVSELNRSF